MLRALPSLDSTQSASLSYFKFVIHRFILGKFSAEKLASDFAGIALATDGKPANNPVVLHVLKSFLSEAIENEKIHVFCCTSIEPVILTYMLDYYGLLPQPGINSFDLLLGIFLCNKVRKKTTNPTKAFRLLFRAASEYNSFFAFFELLNFFLHDLKSLTKTQLEDYDFSRFFEILLGGEIHGTPMYLVRACFYFWSAELQREQGIEVDRGWYYETLKFLYAADKIQLYSEASVTNANFGYRQKQNFFASENALDSGPNFFELLKLIQRGQVVQLIDFVVEKIGITPAEASLAEQAGLSLAREFMRLMQTPVQGHCASIAPVVGGRSLTADETPSEGQEMERPTGGLRTCV